MYVIYLFLFIPFFYFYYELSASTEIITAYTAFADDTKLLVCDLIRFNVDRGLLAALDILYREI